MTTMMAVGPTQYQGSAVRSDSDRVARIMASATARWIATPWEYSGGCSTGPRNSESRDSGWAARRGLLMR